MRVAKSIISNEDVTEAKIIGEKEKKNQKKEDLYEIRIQSDLNTYL